MSVSDKVTSEMRDGLKFQLLIKEPIYLATADVWIKKRPSLHDSGTTGDIFLSSRTPYTLDCQVSLIKRS